MPRDAAGTNGDSLQKDDAGTIDDGLLGEVASTCGDRLLCEVADTIGDSLHGVEAGTVGDSLFCEVAGTIGDSTILARKVRVTKTQKKAKKRLVAQICIEVDSPEQLDVHGNENWPDHERRQVLLSQLERLGASSSYDYVGCFPGG